MIHPKAQISPSSRLWYPELSNIGNCIIGENCVIHAPVWIADGVVIGNNCKIQAFAYLPKGVFIGDDVFIGPHVCFTNDKHPPSNDWGETIIGDEVKIGANSTILPVMIGQGTVIGAGSVVTKDILEGEVWFGNPAKKYEAMEKA